MVTVVFLYTELAPYFLACCNELASMDVRVYVLHYPINQEAPFAFESNPRISLLERKGLTYRDMDLVIQKINPTVLVCSGWIDKTYLKICKKYRQGIPTVLTMDTKWQGSIKQQLARRLSPFVLKNRFSHVWVPGKSQAEYARKLGFKSDQIMTGFYSCDVTFFRNCREQIFPEKKENFPKRFMYTGRYHDFKGLGNLWQAFIELQAENPNEWELWCLGKGSLAPAEHPKIKHIGFVQPEHMEQYAKKCGVFVMPSLFEPWGVVLHEFACLGFPLLVSDQVGAAECFLEDGKNGFSYVAGDVQALKEKLKEFMQLSPEQLNLMGEYSYRLSERITPKIWAENLMKLI